ncbi:P-loop containing nucleoside triphosphate hydrolase protein [Rhizoctonia solani]|nr:P-loop containing nucleoside triphosphate hydrolase protein [Rhizoctonia solani]
MVICSELLTHGVCRTELCTASHVLDFFCSSCNIICTSESTFKAHLGGRKHRSANKTPTLINCLVCSTVLPNSNPYTLNQHSQGNTHQRRLSQLDNAPDPWHLVTEAETPAHLIRCDACNQNVPHRAWAQHLSKDSHIRRSKVANFQSVLRETEKDRHGVEVSHSPGSDSADSGAGVDFGTTDPDNIREVKKAITLRLNTPANVTLSSVRLASAAGQSTRVLPQFHVPETSPTILPLKRFLSLSIYFRPLGHRGYFSDRLELTFHDTSLRKSFTITRPLRATVGNATDLEELRPSAPYVRPLPRPRRDREEKLVDGIKPLSQRIEWVVALPKAIIPTQLKSILESRAGADARLNRIRQLPGMYGGLAGAGSSSYGRFWETLLHVEEHQAEIDLERYDRENVELSRHGSYFYLNVPGLAEKRPSVLIGDSIKVRPHNPSATNNTTWYIGYVHVVRKDEVGLRFAHRFLPPIGTRFDIRFCLNRIPVLRMHQALATAFAEPRVLFPAIVHEKRQLTTRNVRTVNPLISQNPPQLLAIKSIVNLPPGSPPFVIFGPPGTGKTVTAVEAMLQLLLADPTTKVLATAPSNSAADLIARKLLESGKLSQGDLLRLNALSRNPDPVSIHPQVIANSYVRDGSFGFPGVDRLLPADLEYNQYHKRDQNAVKPLKDYRVVVATCVTASVPYQLGVPRGHYDWIFVDEAGQACEPEVMISVKTLAGSATNIVLSGDPRQLGPVIRSPVALQLGLGLSYLERLMNTEAYDPSVMRGRTVVKLSKNWRNHPSILRYPNERFYANELEACASSSITSSLLAWPELGRAGFPIIFENIAGQDMREASSPSWYNPMEVSRVKDYVRMLRDLRRPHISTTDIGVITPYNQQVQHIRKMLRASNGEAIKVGSVEEFQGQERKVIIVSTVRSSAKEVEFDLRHTLGFVANDRRFNVTITRAQALLIIVGDASVLGFDPLWRSFLTYIHREGGWKGSPIPWEGGDAGDAYSANQRSAVAMNDLAALIERTRTMNLSLGGGDAGDADDTDVQEGNVDRPWREDE